MALIPLKAVPLLDGKLIAHIYSDTPTWLLALATEISSSTLPPHLADKDPNSLPIVLYNMSRVSAAVVQCWSGELADEMAGWSRPTRDSDLDNMEIEAKRKMVAALPYLSLVEIVNRFNECSLLLPEKKSESSVESESIETES